VWVPTRGCVNLAACVNVALYDRIVKSGRWAAPAPIRRETGRDTAWPQRAGQATWLASWGRSGTSAPGSAARGAHGTACAAEPTPDCTTTSVRCAAFTAFPP